MPTNFKKTVNDKVSMSEMIILSRLDKQQDRAYLG